MYAIGLGAAHGLETQSLHMEIFNRDLGLEVPTVKSLIEQKTGTRQSFKVEVESDSSAAVGMCSRLGTGRVRHIQTRFLWIQEAVKSVP